jgi:hypothetical protein
VEVVDASRGDVGRDALECSFSSVNRHIQSNLACNTVTPDELEQVVVYLKHGQLPLLAQGPHREA